MVAVVLVAGIVAAGRELRLSDEEEFASLRGVGTGALRSVYKDGIEREWPFVQKPINTKQHDRPNVTLIRAGSWTLIYIAEARHKVVRIPLPIPRDCRVRAII